MAIFTSNYNENIWHRNLQMLTLCFANFLRFGCCCDGSEAAGVVLFVLVPDVFALDDDTVEFCTGCEDVVVEFVDEDIAGVEVEFWLVDASHSSFTTFSLFPTMQLDFVSSAAVDLLESGSLLLALSDDSPLGCANVGVWALLFEVELTFAAEDAREEVWLVSSLMSLWFCDGTKPVLELRDELADELACFLPADSLLHDEELLSSFCRNCESFSAPTSLFKWALDLQKMK